ncbi:hypothetical protein [Puia sp.]|uniref:hypothetical protein n=1 Tax=Puia sp. TaxID=2045100 RepID=UPI002F3F9360
MRKTIGFLVPIVCILIVVSCKKSGALTSQGLGGTWAFLGMSAQTQTTADTTGGVRVVTSASFVTKSNVGTISFNTDSMAVSGLGYTVDTSFTTYFSFNSVVYDSVKQALSYTIPPTSVSAKYTMVGSDSLYFPSGGILAALDSTSKGQGSTYVLKGDSLTLTSQGFDTSGAAVTNIRSVIYLKRQK